MQGNSAPPALRERLGDGATAGLLHLLDRARTEWMAEVMSRVGDRFERRLVEEVSGLRLEMSQGFAAVRQDMTEGQSALRQETTQLGSALRQEIADLGSALRQEMSVGFGAVRQNLTEQRFELLKWAFLFWIGQFFAVASLVAVVIRFLRAGA